MRRVVTALMLLACAPAARAGWIEPVRWQLSPGDRIEAALDEGAPLAGQAQAAEAGARFQVLAPGGAVLDPGAAATAPGLYRLVHVPPETVLRWPDAAAFRAFLEAHELAGILARQADRGLAQGPASALDSHYDKALVAVGAAKGQDPALGLRLELSALADPYAGGPSLPVMLSWAKTPRPGAQLKVYERDGAGAVTGFTLRTDEDGLALVPLKPGHAYLLAAATMLAHLPEGPDAPAWHLYRASLTFATPGA